MAVTYGMQELYGGTMTVELPVNLIDSSDLRQIPDNQEVLLSPTTLTSVVFEINEYVEPSTTAGFNPTTTTTTTTQPDGTTTTTTVTAVNGTSSSTEADAEAAKYHFTDVIAEPDTLADDLPEPQSVTMQHSSLAEFPASILSGNINSVDPRPGQQQQRSSQPGTLQRASSSSSTGGLLESIVHQIQLLVRLKDYDTDLCVRVNVPLKEIARDDGQIAAEVTLAKEVLARVVATLEIRDFGLFGED